MSKFGGLWVGMALIAGVTNYAVKQMVQSTANELGAVQRKTVAEQKEIHELSADWTFLNQPELLADLNKRYVGLVPMSPKQVGALIDNIPLRPAAPTPLDPAPEIAEAAPVSVTPSGTPDQVVALDPPPLPVTQAAFAAPVPARAMPMPPTAAAPVAVAAPAAVSPPAPIVRVAAPAPSRPPAPASPASLDALFAQVAGGR
jgi:hypothetical protein